MKRKPKKNDRIDVDRYSYREWLASVDRLIESGSDHNWWLMHERFQRVHASTDDEMWIDLGGEA